MQILKTCSRCKQQLTSESFYGNKRTSDGLQTVCKVCSRLNSQEWKTKNPEKFRKLQKQWCEKNPEKLKELHKAWRLANPDKMKEYKRRYYLKKKAQ